MLLSVSVSCVRPHANVKGRGSGLRNEWAEDENNESQGVRLHPGETAGPGARAAGHLHRTVLFAALASEARRDSEAGLCRHLQGSVTLCLRKACRLACST